MFQTINYVWRSHLRELKEYFGKMKFLTLIVIEYRMTKNINGEFHPLKIIEETAAA